ncbi:MAG: bifunctional N-acetylglucosamine-1-phosphate uridyltransferase/glucosamine-1-phosphate acetyltransferase [Candidatus Omnitrophica bacterium]|nr:bifunctional N-acetylglucosamine-1-phosphate uridyltransferase/glucosamine-1-phosphate acetyltransferase [Candidatus Omnitrophota bacterium]
MTKKTKAVILAGGLGTRMKSDIPKVLHHLNGRPMIDYVLDAANHTGIKDIICVTGHKAGMVKRSLKGIKVVKQKRPLGSADAVKQARKFFKTLSGDLLVLCGDAPLIRPQTIKRLKRVHRKEKNSCTLLSARMADPTGYGRIVRDYENNVAGIVEELETSTSQKSINEINAGVYFFDIKKLFPLLAEIKNDNSKKEYFLTDIISLMHKKRLKVNSVLVDDSDEVFGINTRSDLSTASSILRKRKLKELMDAGVTIVAPESTYIDETVRIERDTIIYPYTVIEGQVRIGRDCRIGPFARIRSGCELKKGVEIGNFVELTRTKIDKDTKIKHHTYLGDAIIGKGVNVGAGTITANYDGKGKYVTKIDDKAFIGSGTILVAPVKVGKNAVTGAGAVVTKKKNVPPNSVVVGIPAKLLKTVD